MPVRVARVAADLVAVAAPVALPGRNPYVGADLAGLAAERLCELRYEAPFGLAAIAAAPLAFGATLRGGGVLHPVEGAERGD
jgi:hypothetical protein